MSRNNKSMDTSSVATECLDEDLHPSPENGASASNFELSSPIDEHPSTHDSNGFAENSGSSSSNSNGNFTLGSEALPPGSTPLHIAAAEGKMHWVRKLARRESLVKNRQRADGCTPLCAAALSGKYQVVRFLLVECNVAIDLPMLDGTTPIHAAVRKNHTNVVRLLAHHGADCKGLFKLTDGTAPIHTAALNGCVAILKLLLDKGADPNLQKRNGITPFYASAYNGHTEAVRFLTTVEGLDIHRPTHNGTTPLHAAAYNGHSGVIRWLLVAKADPHTMRADGSTALYLAALNGHFEAACVLFNAMDDLACREPAAVSSMHIAAHNGHSAILTFFLDRGVDSNVPAPSTGLSAVYAAAFNGHLEAVRALVEHGADLSVERSRLGAGPPAIPLHAAAYRGHLDVVRYLLEQPGVDKEQVNDEGATALYASAVSGRLDVVQYLCEEKHCDRNRTRADGSTPLFAACHNGHFAVVKYLCHTMSCDRTKARHNGTTPLQAAAGKGHLPIVAYLLNFSHLQQSSQPPHPFGSASMSSNSITSEAHTTASAHSLPTTRTSTHESLNSLAATGSNPLATRSIPTIRPTPTSSSSSSLSPTPLTHQRPPPFSHALCTEYTNAMLAAARHGHLPIVRYCMRWIVTSAMAIGSDPLADPTFGGGPVTLSSTGCCTRATNNGGRNSSITSLGLPPLSRAEHSKRKKALVEAERSRVQTLHLARACVQPLVAMWLEGCQGWNALQFAVDAHDIRMVVRMIRLGADLEIQDSLQRSCLMIARMSRPLDLHDLANLQPSSPPNPTRRLTAPATAVNGGGDQALGVTVHAVTATPPAGMRALEGGDDADGGEEVFGDDLDGSVGGFGLATDVLQRALQPWRPAVHSLFPPAFRSSIKLLLLLRHRRIRGIPSLPQDLWWVILAYCPRNLEIQNHLGVNGSRSGQRAGKCLKSLKFRSALSAIKNVFSMITRKSNNRNRIRVGTAQ